MPQWFKTLRCRLRYLMVAGLLIGSCLVPIASSLAQSPAAQQEFLFAYKLMQRGDLAEAAEAFDSYLRAFTQDVQRGDAVYFRAVLYRKAGELERAAECLDDAPPTGRVPGYALELLRGQLLTDLGRYDQAIASLEQVDTQLLPDRAVASVLLLRGLAYRGAGNFEAAQKATSQAAAIDSPVKARALLERARAQAPGGDLAAAVASLEEAIELDDASVTPQAARYAGDLSYQLGQLDVAGLFYSRVIESHQASAEFGPAVTGRMWADLKAGRSVSVVSAYKQFSASLSKDQVSAARYLAASAYQALEQHAQAAEILTEYVAAGDQQSMQALALYKLAVSQFELGRYADMQRTVEHLDRAFVDSPQRMDAGFLYASAQAKQGHTAAGVARLEPFIAEGPENPYYLQALLRRAALYELDGALEAAADDLQRYLHDLGEPASTVPVVALRYVDVLHRLGRYEQAAATCQILLAAEPEPAAEQESFYRLGEAQTRAKQYQKALATFDTLQGQYPINPYRHAVTLRRGLLLNQLGQPERATQVLVTAADDERLPVGQRVAALRIIAARMRDTDRAEDAALTLSRMETVGGLGALGDDELLWRADYHVQQGDAVEALRVLSVFGQDDRQPVGAVESQVLYVRGQAHLMLGQFDDAHRSFFGVVALGRGFDLRARLGLARTQLALENHDAALIELSDLVNAEDGAIRAAALYETALARRARARLMRRRGQDQRVEEELQAARAPVKRMVVLYLTTEALRPLQERGLIELAEIAQELGENQTMVKEYQELIRAFGDSSYAVYAKAVLAHTQRQRSDDALALLRGLQEDPALDPPLAQRVETLVAELEALR